MNKTEAIQVLERLIQEYEVAISTYPDGSSTQLELRMIASALNISLNALKVSVEAPWHDEIAKEKQRMKWW